MRTSRALVLVAALTLAFAACGDGSGSDTTTTTTEATTTTTAASTTTAGTTTEATTTTAATTTEATTTTTFATTGRFVTTADSAHGEILVDQDGFTLYLFEQDTQNGTTSACNNACAITWPPLENGDIGAGEGTDPALFGSIERSDGITQVTYNGWPLYYYAPDLQAGDTNGQGAGGRWWVVSPGGDAIKA